MLICIIVCYIYAYSPKDTHICLYSHIFKYTKNNFVSKNHKVLSNDL